MTDLRNREWDTTTLDAAMGSLVGGGTPSRTKKEYWGGEIPWATVKDLLGKQLSSTQETITRQGLENSSATLVPSGVLILATRMAVGRVAKTTREIAINQDLKAITAAKTVDIDFLQQWFMSCEATLNSLSSGSTVRGLTIEALKSIPIELPPLAEQKKIAEILSSVDEVIENTESEINKLEDLKKATLNELLTKGIGHTEFKETEIGRIPKSWEVKSLQEICVQGGLQTGPFGGQLHAEEYVQVGVPVVMPQDISGSVITTENIARVSEEKTLSLQRHRLRVGDIVFSRRGDIGRFALVTKENDGWICGTGCIRARPRQEILLSRYLSTYCNLEQTKRWLVRNAVGQTMPNLSTEILSNLPIAIPTHAEQTVMIGVSQSIDFTIESKRRWFREALMGREALMQDLLTGKVRVKVN